jgi:cyclic pyranopterin phosphate synthase
MPRRRHSDAAGDEGLGGNARASRVWKGGTTKICAFSFTPDIQLTDSGFCFFGRATLGASKGKSRSLTGVRDDNRSPSERKNLDMTLHDKFGRQITDLRISITDRCNFRCVYCRSADPENYRDHEEILSWPELDRLARVFLNLGIRKIRITGGEPLVREGVEDYIARLHALGVEDLSMTTNGHLLADRCERLIQAGLRRINISLDSLDPAKFEKITRTKSFAAVMRGIDSAQHSRLAPAKINAVLVRGTNDDEVEAFADFARQRGVIMRFIEFMPLDADRTWTRSLMVPAAEVYRRIHARWPLEQIPHECSETARKYRFADGAPGEIGLIAPVTQPFCGHCSRIRLTADGKLRTCLFSKDDHDLRALLREGATDEDLVIYIRSVVMDKEEGHRINDPGFVPPSRTMVFIGG